MIRKQVIFYFLWSIVDLSIRSNAYEESQYHDIKSFEKISNWHKHRHPRSYEDVSSDLVKKALQIVRLEKEGVNVLEIHKCLSKFRSNTNMKLNCVKRLLSKQTLIRNGNLSRNQNDHFGHSEFKRVNGNHKHSGVLAFASLVDRKVVANDLDGFSLDYFDVDDILRSNKKMVTVRVKLPLRRKRTRNRYVFKLTPIKGEFPFNLTKSRRFGYTKDFVKKKILRTLSDESESDADGDSSPELKRDKKGGSLQRFQVTDKTEESEDNSESEDDVPVQRPKQTPKKNAPIVLYMQAPTRILKIKRESRRRLPHFFPKRFHWDEEDMSNLGNFWFNGPQGKYSGPYKTPY